MKTMILLCGTILVLNTFNDKENEHDTGKDN